MTVPLYRLCRIFWLITRASRVLSGLRTGRLLRPLDGSMLALGLILDNWRHDTVWQEFTWAKAIHRVAAEGISPEQAVEEAIARIKEILSK